MAIEELLSNITRELDTIWAAHKNVGLEGYMCLYTPPTQDPMRNKSEALAFWFTAEETSNVTAHIKEHYNNGELPNSSLLLNPLVHSKQADGSYKPVGSGIIWATALALGIDRMQEEQMQRINNLGAFAAPFVRGENKRAGIKIIAFADSALPVEPDGTTVAGCRALYEIADIKGEAYHYLYMLGGMTYLATHGLYLAPSFEALPDAKPASIKKSAISAKSVQDAAACWDAYDRHHSLYQKFGQDTKDIEHNVTFFNLCARDVELFDATGPMRKSADESFEFIVPGLIPRGSVTLIAAAGGTGKSSVAHQLCTMAAIDYADDEPAPRWLGQPLNTDLCKGICVYFSGEDGPPIINARQQLFDPEGKAKRLMFQRTDFGEGKSIGDFLHERLFKMPDVPIMVVDPARKYLEGDENDADVVSRFFEAMEEFAIKKRCAVIVVHHLQKGANPQSAREVLDELRGSQVFIDRPRVVLGMYRDQKHTVVGLAKNNIPPNLGMVMEERVFVRNPKNLQLIWLPGNEGVKNAFLPDEELEALERESAATHYTNE